MVCCPGVEDPGPAAVGVVGVGVARARIVRLVGVVETVSTAQGVVAVLATNLACRAVSTAAAPVSA